MTFRSSIIFTFFFFLSLAGRTQNSLEVLVEDFRIKEGFAEPAPSITVIESDEIKKNGGTTVAEVINMIPGLIVAQNGGPNQPTSVFIRGSESRHTLVLVDNMELNDPINPSRSFDFSSLTTENIERIEIYRGAQSVRFGSDAIGGVINIITKQGAGQLSGNSQLEYGSYNSLKAAVEALGSKNNFNYSFGVSQFSSTGFSAADKKDGNSESDGYRRLSLSTRFGWNVSSDTNINMSLRTTELQTDLDAYGGPTGDDPNSTSNSRQYQAGIFLKSRAFDKKLSYSFGLTAASNERKGENPVDSLQPTQSTDKFSAASSKFESRNDYFISDEQSFQFGFQLRNEKGHSENTFNLVPSDLGEHSQYINGVYLSHKYESDRIFTDLGVRGDSRGQSDNITSTAIGFGYKFSEYDSAIRIDYGTGFKTPGLYQLYSSYGNSALIDEKSNSTSFSYEQKWASSLLISASYFSNQYYDLIDFDLIDFKYINIAKSSSRGAELQVNWQISSSVSLKTALTNMQTKNEADGLKLLRRPENSFSAQGTYKQDLWESTLEYLYIGNRDDIDPVTYLRFNMPSYDLINFRASYVLEKTLNINLRFINLLNRKYQEVAGFGTSEAAGYIGLTKAF